MAPLLDGSAPVWVRAAIPAQDCHAGSGRSTRARGSRLLHEKPVARAKSPSITAKTHDPPMPTATPPRKSMALGLQHPLTALIRESGTSDTDR